MSGARIDDKSDYNDRLPTRYNEEKAFIEAIMRNMLLKNYQSFVDIWDYFFGCCVYGACVRIKTKLLITNGFCILGAEYR